jgi:hypothetical protein
VFNGNKPKKETLMKQTKRMNLAIMAAGLLCAGLIFGTDASAAENACSEDIAKFCQNIEPGRIALMDCLEKHESELTAACKAQEAGMEGKRTERMETARQAIKFRQACQNDMVQFCNDANPGPGGMLKCLNDHNKEISASCSESMKMMVE